MKKTIDNQVQEQKFLKEDLAPEEVYDQLQLGNIFLNFQGRL